MASASANASARTPLVLAFFLLPFFTLAAIHPDNFAYLSQPDYVDNSTIIIGCYSTDRNTSPVISQTQSDITTGAVACLSAHQSYAQERYTDNNQNDYSYQFLSCSNSDFYYNECSFIRYFLDCSGSECRKINHTAFKPKFLAYQLALVESNNTPVCPPETNPAHTILVTEGAQNYCSPVQPDVLETSLDQQCSGSFLPVGANVAQSVCHTDKFGRSCSYELDIHDPNHGDSNGYQYYNGQSFVASCADSGLSEYADGQSGTDGNCVAIDGQQYCQADRAKHCNNVAGELVCDDGCFQAPQAPDILLCDTSKHADADPDNQQNEGYWDSDGSCSLGAIYRYRGMCEDYGGTWSPGEPAGDVCASPDDGFCSLGNQYLSCYSCLDAGGNWTPDSPNAPPECDAETDPNCDINSNKLLRQIEENTRKENQLSNENLGVLNKIDSSISQGVGQLNDSLRRIDQTIKDKPTGGGAGDDTPPTWGITFNQSSERETGPLDDLFGEAQVAEVREQAIAAKETFSEYLSQIRTEASSLLEIDVTPGAYESTILDMTFGSFDVSWSRWMPGLSQLGNIIMLIAALVGLTIILRRPT